jgi:aerobic C4-dicarboxylate transport protein
VNIVGNCVATVAVGYWEKAVDRNKLRQELQAG